MLVTKKVMLGDCGAACCAWPAVEPSDTNAADATIAMHFILDIVVLPLLFEAPGLYVARTNGKQANGRRPIP